MDFLLSVTLPAEPCALSCSPSSDVCVTESPDDSPQPGLMRIVPAETLAKFKSP